MVLLTAFLSCVVLVCRVVVLHSLARSNAPESGPEQHKAPPSSAVLGKSSYPTQLQTFTIQLCTNFDDLYLIPSPHSGCQNFGMASPSGDKGKGKATDEDLPMLNPTELQIAVLEQLDKDEFRTIYISNVGNFNYVLHEAVQRTLKAKHWNDAYEDVVKAAILSAATIEVPSGIVLPSGGPASGWQTLGLIPQIPHGLEAMCSQLYNLQFTINIPGNQFRKGCPADVEEFLGTARIMPGLARITPLLKSFNLKIIINTGLDLVKDARAGYWKDLMCIDRSTPPPLNDQLNKPVWKVIDEVLAAVKTSFPSKVTKMFKLVARYDPAEYRGYHLGSIVRVKSWQFNCRKVNLDKVKLDWLDDEGSPFSMAWRLKKEEPLTVIPPS